MPQDQQSLRNSTPESLRTFLDGLEAERDQWQADRARKLGSDPDSDVRSYDRKVRDLDIKIEVTRHVCEAYHHLEEARDATKGQSEAATRVELSKLLLRIDEFFAKKA
jgi:hypothetical protein